MGTGLSHADFAVADEPDDALFTPPPSVSTGQGVTAPAPRDPPPLADGHALVARLRRIAAASGDRVLPVIDFDAPAQGFEDDLEPASPVPGASA